MNRLSGAYPRLWLVTPTKVKQLFLRLSEEGIMGALVRESGDSEPSRNKRSRNEPSKDAPKDIGTASSSRATEVPETPWRHKTRRGVFEGDVAVVEPRSRLTLAPERIPEIVQHHRCISSASDFDYASVPVSVARFLKGQATRIRQYTSRSIIQIGKDLAGAKHYLSHGQFVRWVQAEVGIPARTAQGYMHAAQWASGKSATVALLPPSVLYVLSASNTPKALVEEILKKAEAGERIVLSTVRARLRALRDAKRCARINGYIAGVPAMHDDDFDQYRGISSGEAALMEAVRILVRALSGSDLARIREIMISNEVLRQPNLSRNIKIVFSAIPDWNGQRNEIQEGGVVDEISVPG
jgi:hypothetical protein